MPGASVLNAWAAGVDGADGRFELMIVTEDPTNRTLIAANLVGTWLEETPPGVAPAADRVGP